MSRRRPLDGVQAAADKADGEKAESTQSESDLARMRALFKTFGGLDSIPIVLDTKDPDEIVETLLERETVGFEALSAPLDAMSLGEFEPDVWIPALHTAARRGTISLDELARMDVIHGPRQAEPGTYDAWTRVLRTVNDVRHKRNQGIRDARGDVLDLLLPAADRAADAVSPRTQSPG